MRVLGIMFWMGVLGGLGCLGGPVGEPVGTHSEALTAGQVNALNNVGRSTGITYRLSVHPDPDLPVLSMAFAPIADLVRAVDVYPPDPDRPARATWFQVLDTTSNERMVFASSSCPATQECSP